MRRDVRSSGYCVLITLTIVAVASALFVAPTSVGAIACTTDNACFRGQNVFVSPSYGSLAYINTYDPAVPNGDASFMWSNANSFGAGHERFVQTGWTKQNTVCGFNMTVVVAEWTYDGSDDHQECFSNPTTGYHSYYSQNNAYGYWCHGLDNDACFRYESEVDVGMGNADYIGSYGETNNTDAQMGGPNQSNAGWLIEIKYKPDRNGILGTSVTSQGDPYGNCGVDVCPYGEAWEFAYGTLQVAVWTL